MTPPPPPEGLLVGYYISQTEQQKLQWYLTSNNLYVHSTTSEGLPCPCPRHFSSSFSNKIKLSYFGVHFCEENIKGKPLGHG